MDNITNVTFNFDALDENVRKLLSLYNNAKEGFCAGFIAKGNVLYKGEAVLEAIGLCIELIDSRLILINEYMDDKFHNKQALRKERLKLTKKIDEYNHLSDFIEEECKQIENDVYETDDFIDYDEPGSC